MKKILAVIAAAIMVLSLAGCRTSSSSDGGKDTLTLFNWTEYMPQSVLDEFKKETGITVKMPTYSSNEEMIAKLESGGTSNYDMAVASNYEIKLMQSQNLIQPIDTSKITNLNNIDSHYLNMNFDKGNKYTVPYMLSFTILVVNKDKIHKDITSLNDLLDPSFNRSIVAVDDERDMVGLALKACGYSNNETDKAKLEQAKKWLIKLKPNIVKFDNDSPKDALINGDASIGIVYNGEAALAINETLSGSSKKNIQVIWPKEGAVMSTDNFVITKGAKHKENAEKFINFFLQPKIAKMVTDAYPYTTPNTAALKLMGNSYLNNPASNITAAQSEKCGLVENVGEATTLFDNIWSEVRSS